jgi:hypothetical protein
MHGKTKVGAFLFAMLLPALAGPALAATAGTVDPGPTGPAQIPNTGINSDVSFPWGVNPICGLKITVYGSQPVNFYTGGRMPPEWLPPDIVADPLHPGYWTVTFRDKVTGKCYDRNDPRWFECGVFKGVHFGFYTDDPVVHFLSPDSSVWSQVGPPCVFFDSNGNEVPCGGLTSHGVQGGVVAIHNDTPAAAAAVASRAASAASQGLLIQNARIAVVPDIIPINNLGPCDLQALPWQGLQLADNVLPPSDGEVGTLNVPIPDNILAQQGWAVMTYDVVDSATGEVLTTSTLDFPLH